LAEAGAATEILGVFIYPLGKIPADRPIFENRNSRIALVYGNLHSPSCPFGTPGMMKMVS
jgi:hypothetical protein